jgi:hypothetical protein
MIMKNYAVLQVLIVLLILPFFSGCKKSEDTSTPQPQVFVYTPPTIATQADVDNLLVTDINLLSGFFPTAQYKVTIGKNFKVIAPSKRPWTIAAKDYILQLDKAVKELVWNKANSKPQSAEWQAINSSSAMGTILQFNPEGTYGIIYNMFYYSDGAAAVSRTIFTQGGSTVGYEASEYSN